MKNDVPKIYKKVASIYDVWGQLTESKARKRCLDLADIRDGESVLEVAVGTGLAFVEILGLNPTGKNEGIDLTEEMLDRAQEKAQRLGVTNYSLNTGDAYNLQYSDDSFDVVINNYMFDLLPENDFSAVLTEFRRVLRPGGRLVMVNMTKPEHWYNSVWEMIYRMNPAWVGGCRGVFLGPYLESVGFVDIRREFISQRTFPSEVVYGSKPKSFSSDRT
ncbi:MAG: methyltransferase domain-containing protein [Syntrophobacterales bacterium]|jgi:ubiquinone/menaquinone biosynthesis C-methylase UbiE